jgi:hypothetical protein
MTYAPGGQMTQEQFGTTTTTTANFVQPPSTGPGQDLYIARQSGISNNVVVGARDKKVYIYDSSGTKATLPLKQVLEHRKEMTMTAWKNLIVLCCCLLLSPSVRGQTDCVRLKFEVDGKEVEGKFKILLYLGDKTIEPTLDGKSFIVPSEVKSENKIDVRFLADQYDLLFKSVDKSAFKTDWTVGVDNKPFDEENTASEVPDPREKDLLIIYYINFTPKGKGAMTRLVVKVYK